jgi:hypothetical protein
MSAYSSLDYSDWEAQFLDPCCGCDCEDDDECEKCFEKMIMEEMEG